MNEYTVIVGICGFILGLGLIWFVSRHRWAAGNQLLEDRAAQLDELKARLKQHEDANYRARIAQLETLLESERRSISEKIALLEQAEKNMTTSFENLANRIIEEKSKKFTEQNKLNIGEVLNPLREQLGDFRKKIEDVYDKESKDRLSLHHEITSLKSLNEQMSKDAINLTRALKGDSKKRGNWGEVILERVLEDSGLKNGREYETQGSFRDEDGKLFYPDVVVHLPNNKDVVIDSKVSLNAYERYCSTEDENGRKQALNDHITSIRNHVSGLQGKNYAELVKVNSLDMVLMFVPIEPALMLAFEQDENLYQDAFKQGIFLVSPSTLTMNLHIIHNMWRYEYQNRNAQQIAKSAGDMYDKFVGFVEALEDIGDKLDKAQSAYQTAHNRLIEGKGNLVKRAEDMRKLGLETSKKLPDNFINKISDMNVMHEISDDTDCKTD
jgi:DNA recombination protein RmuC